MDSATYWQRIQRSRLTRRRALIGAASGGAVLTASLAVGCSSSSSNKPSSNAPASSSSAPGASPAAKQPKKGGTLQRNSTSGAFLGSFDPHIQAPSQTGEMGFFYQGMVRLNPTNLTVEPELTQKWEQPDQNTYNFTIQPGVKWHNKPPANARAMTADDIVYSVNRLRTNDPKFINRTLLDSVDKVTTTSPTTLQITTKTPDAGTLSNLSSLSLKVLAPEVVDKAGKFTTADTAVGTGAFVVQSRDDTQCAVVRNPDYWKQGMPYLDGAHLIVFQDPTAAWAAFQANQLDTGYIPGQDAQKLMDQQNKPFNSAYFSDVGFVGIQANLHTKPFDDIRIARALRLLVDHQEIEKAWGQTWFGKGYMTFFLGANLSSWDYTADEYQSKFLEFKTPKDDAIKQALQMLSAAGYDKNKPLQFTISGLSATAVFPASSPANQLLQAQFARNGQGAVKADIKELNEVLQRETLANRSFAYFITNLVPGQPYEPDSWFRTFFYKNGSRNYGYYDDAQMNDLIDKQRAIFDQAQRKAAVKAVIDYGVNNAPYTSWSGRYNPNAYQKKVQNFLPEGNSAVWGTNYERVWFDA